MVLQEPLQQPQCAPASAVGAGCSPFRRCTTVRGGSMERAQDLGYGYSKFSMAKKNFFDSLIYKFRAHNSLLIYHNNNIAFFSQASWILIYHKQNKIKATTIHWGQNCLLYVSPTGDLPKSFIVVQKNN